MLLESALADFPTDDSRVFRAESGTVPFEWETTPGNPKALSKGGSNSGPSEIKHAYQLKLLPNKQAASGGPSVKHTRQTLTGQKETPNVKVSHSRPLSGSLDQSRSPPPLDLNLGPTTASGVLKNRSLTSGPGEISLHDDMPITENRQPGKAKMQKDRNVYRAQQLPQARVISVKERNVSAAPGRQSLGKSPGPAQSKENKKQQRSRASIPQTEIKPPQSSKFRLGDVMQTKKRDSSNSYAPRRRNYSSISNVNSFGNMESEFGYVEEVSPVSTLERIPSPPVTTSSGSSGSSLPGQKIGSAPVLQQASVPGLALARRHLPSFSSNSAQSSPRVSTSSSARYMGHCLVALQAALAVDPEKSRRFEDSFVELDYIEEHERTFSLDHVLERTDRGSQGWARGVHSELEPEYSTMDFGSDREDDQESNLSSSCASSPARSVSGSSTTSFMSRPIRRSLNQPRVSVDEYSVKDKRFLSDHPSSWVQHGDDSISSSLSNSKRSILSRHQDVSWDDQQADLNPERAEEVVRGAIDGLRFTYSPVSSAFVFARSNEEDELEDASEPKFYRHSRRDAADTGASRRLSISLDYASSIGSEDSLSFARGSDVPELGLSRAESWSKVARGIAFQNGQQGYQDAVPSSFLKRAGNDPPFEDGVGTQKQSSESKPRGISECNDSRLIRKRASKKLGMVTCLPFRSILRNFTAIGSPGRSRLGLASTDRDRQLSWASPTVNRHPYY